MKRIELVSCKADADTIHYVVCEDNGVGLLQNDRVDLFIKFHTDEKVKFDLKEIPQSILQIPISLFLLPITYFYKVELVIPEMDKGLYDRLPQIYNTYSKIYGPFKDEWRGNLTIKSIVDAPQIGDAKYDRVVFFSGGVDACHASINYPGGRTLLVSIPDIEHAAKNSGPLREEKFSLIKNFSSVVKSDWLLISNNFNNSLFKDDDIQIFLRSQRGLNSSAFVFDGWPGIKYLANMCSVAPIAYYFGIKELIMGSSFEQIEDKLLLNYDGANPELTDTIGFANTHFGEQEGLMVRRSKKVVNIIDWCNAHGVKTKLWACFRDGTAQCGFCAKCIRTQLNILCAGENPKDWGFENFSEKEYTRHIKSYKYVESNPCWLWDNLESIDDKKHYPYCDEVLHWLKSIGYKEYHRCSQEISKTKPSVLKRLIAFRRYPHYVKKIATKLFGDK